MLTQYWMSKPAITLEKTALLKKAAAQMREKRIRMLPVTDCGKLCGIITDGEIKKVLQPDDSGPNAYMPGRWIPDIAVSDVMTKDVLCAHPDWTIEEVADLLLLNKISGAPVVDDAGTIIGVITQSDIFKSTLYLTGLRQRGVHLALVLEDTPGSIMEIVNIIRQFDGRMASILSTYDRAPNQYRNVYLRFYNVSRDRMDQMLDILRGKAKLRYLVDHRENRRVIFAST
ncbi:CBS domain-containing protein [Desulfosarcina sp. OttesenSCG-928-A07]|nr:CBS domain-containing protein [Desulfosarcina sp. OttesenSCG-928-G17]MDL2329121.1 CBS domain-containing protein [Desulfosarcina sp. OttesenSCG-928-A07]